MKFLPLLLLSLIACSQSEARVAQVYVDGSLPQVTKDLIHQDVKELQTRAGEKFLEIDGDLRIYVTVAETGRTPDGLKILGLSSLNGDSCLIRMDPVVIDAEIFLLVLKHEIGHCFGLVHVPERKAVMFALTIPVDQDNEKSIGEFMRSLAAVRKEEK